MRQALGRLFGGRFWALALKELRQIRRDRRLAISLIVPPTTVSVEPRRFSMPPPRPAPASCPRTVALGVPSAPPTAWLPLIVLFAFSNLPVSSKRAG